MSSSHLPPDIIPVLGIPVTLVALVFTQDKGPVLRRAFSGLITSKLISRIPFYAATVVDGETYVFKTTDPLFVYPADYSAFPESYKMDCEYEMLQKSQLMCYEATMYGRVKANIWVPIALDDANSFMEKYYE